MELLSVATQDAFAVFIEDQSSFALILDLADNDRVEARAPIHQSHSSFQLDLNELERHLDISQPAYIVLQRNDSLTLITYVPYRARENVCSFFLAHRHDVVRQLDEKHITCSMICKEIAEITDARSWVERDAADTTSTQSDNSGPRTGDDDTEDGTKDVGYRKNKCRLCDRRMKNKITSEALEALNRLQTPGTAVQIVRPTSR